MTVCLNHVFMLNIFFIKFFVDLFIFSPSQIVQLILQKSLLHRPLIMITGRITMKGYASVLKPDLTLTIGAGHSSPPPLPCAGHRACPQQSREAAQAGWPPP